jgi:hypothetical protein
MLLVLIVVATPLLAGGLSLAWRGRSPLWRAAGALLALATICVPGGSLLVIAECGLEDTRCDSGIHAGTVLVVGLLASGAAAALAAAGLLLAAARAGRRRTSG